MSAADLVPDRLDGAARGTRALDAGDPNRGANFVKQQKVVLSRSTAIVLGAWAGLIGYLGVGISIWQVAPGIMPQALYVFVVSTCALLLLVRQQSRRIAELDDGEGLLVSSLGRLEQVEHLMQGTFGLVVNLLEEPRSETAHHFRCITEEYLIHGNNGTYNWTFEGHCVAARSQDLVVKVCGDTPCDEDALAISVTDERRGGKRLDFEVLVDGPYCKVLAIFFVKPLARGDDFSVKFSCRWDNTFPRTRRFDYVFSAWAVYAKAGLDRIEGRLVCDLPLVDFTLKKLEDGVWVDASSQPREVHSSRRRTELEWAATSPTHIYQLAFEKDL